MAASENAHWQGVYADCDPRQVSWFEPVPDASLAYIAEAGLPTDAAILDAGGGTSSLAGELLRRGYSDVTVADISGSAIERAKDGLGEGAGQVTWLRADLVRHGFDRRYDLWHDRAVFHFMVEEADRAAYLAALRSALQLRGHLVLATFGPDGPTECSGLPTCRYSAETLAGLLGGDFRLLASRLVDHTTPSGSRQQFLYTHFQRVELA